MDAAYRNQSDAQVHIRRALRIAPRFWLAIPVYLVINGTGLSDNAPNGIGPVQVILTAMFLHGFWPDSVNSVVPGDWSIAAEMTFYFVFPLLVTAFGSRRHLYVALAIVLHLVNVCLFKPRAFALFSSYYSPGHEAFVWTRLHISFLNQLPVFLVGCALFFSLRDGFAKLEAAIYAVFIALSFVANRVTGSHLMINLALGAPVAGCIKLAIRFRPREALGRNSYSIYLSHFAVIYGLRQLWPLADGLVSLLIAYVVTAAALSRRTRDMASGRTAAQNLAPPDIRGIGPVDPPADYRRHHGRHALNAPAPRRPDAACFIAALNRARAAG